MDSLQKHLDLPRVYFVQMNRNDKTYRFACFEVGGLVGVATQKTSFDSSRPVGLDAAPFWRPESMSGVPRREPTMPSIVFRQSADETQSTRSAAIPHDVATKLTTACSRGRWLGAGKISGRPEDIMPCSKQLTRGHTHWISSIIIITL